MQNIIGHKKILDFFDKAIAAGRLSHAYCFSGPEHIGKKTVAEFIGARILNVPQSKLFYQPDFLFVKQELNKKTGGTNKNINAEQIRELRFFLSQKSFLGGYKVAIIDEAEKMNESSANVLLKTLEEPRGKTILFLVTKDETLLPSTIVSRCQVLFFSPVDKNEVVFFAKNNNINDEMAEEMAKLSAGMPGKVNDWIQDISEYENYKKEIIRFMSLINKPFYEKIEKVDDLFGDKTDHIAARENLQNILSIWQTVLRGFLHTNIGILEKRGKISLENKKIVRLSNLISESKERLSENIHPRLVLEQVLLEIP